MLLGHVVVPVLTDDNVLASLLMIFDKSPKIIIIYGFIF